MIETVNYENVRYVPKNNYSPNFQAVKNWIFPYDKDSEQDELRAIEEANLADALARVGSRNGLTVNDFQHLFPAILRMLKSSSEWTK